LQHKAIITINGLIIALSAIVKLFFLISLEKGEFDNNSILIELSNDIYHIIVYQLSMIAILPLVATFIFSFTIKGKFAKIVFV